MTRPTAQTEPSARDDAERPIDRLIAIMAQLRDPERGCPWDVAQSFETIAPYTVEEAYEVADAIARGDTEDLRDELGDLLLQVVFHARMAQEAGLFGFEDVARAIGDKLVRRHPHVFADGAASDEAAVRGTWEAIKAEERAEKAARRAAAGLPARSRSVVDEVPVALPALARAAKMQKRVARVGFDWPADAEGAAGVRAKIHEEIGELEDALAETGADGPSEAAVEEFGDLLFTLVNFARRHGIDPEAALTRTNDKFARRFRKMEQIANSKGKSLSDLDFAALEALWHAAKRDATGADDA